MNWYYVQDSDRVGPVDDGEFERLAAAGRIQPETLVWNETLPGWTPLRDARPGAAAAASIPSPAPIDPASAPRSTCSQCGQSFSPDQLMHFEGRTICFNCKPLFVARMKEGIAPAMAVTYGGFWIRFLAVLIDGAIAFTVGMLIGLVFGTARAVGGRAPFTASGCISSFLQLLYGVGYETLLVGAYGATLGKMALRLKVVTPDGGRVSYMTALGRYFAKILSAIILLIGYIMAAFDEEKRALHDRICNTRVIRT
ncbi:MAG TPA: RDD family protein [Thermoanaerobaculia bacterium]